MKDTRRHVHVIFLLLVLAVSVVANAKCKPAPIHADMIGDTVLKPAVFLSNISNNYAAPVSSSCTSEQEKNCGR